MQVPPLENKDLDEFLSKAVVAKIATVSRSGDIRITPIWFGRQPDGSILMNTFEDSGLVRNLKRSPRCSLMVDSVDWPYIGVHFWGAASVEGPENDVDGIGKLFAPYVGSLDDAKDYAKKLIGWGRRVYVRFRPQRSTTWDFREG